MAEWDALFGIIPSMLVNQQLAERFENVSKYQQPKQYTLQEAPTTEYIPKKELPEYQKLSPEEQLQAAKKMFSAEGQTVLSTNESGKVAMKDFFKGYKTPEDFNADMAALLSRRDIGQVPMTDEQYANNLQTWYATQANDKGEKTYARDLLGTKKRANAVRTTLLDPNFQQLNQQQQAAFLSTDNLIHNSFKSEKLKKAENELNAAKTLKAQTAINIAQEKIDEIKSSGAGVDQNKVQQMQENIQRGWDAAKSISAKLNNNVSPEIIFAQIANETGYLTKPIALNNLTSIKITRADRAELKRQRQQKEYEQKLLSIFPDIFLRRLP